VAAKCPIRVLELRSVRGTGGGPEKTILLGSERTDPSRFAVTVCYLRDRRDPIFSIDERARGRVEYVEILEKHSFDPGIWTRLRSLVRHGKYDIVHAHEYKTDLLAYAVSRVESVVPLATAHGWTGHSRRERLYYAADRRLLGRFPRVIAVSGEIREVLVRCGADPARIRVILNGIDPVAFRRNRAEEQAARAAFGVESNAFAIGSVGRLEPQKRFDLLLEAFAALRAERPSLRLLIAGDGSLRCDLQKLADRLGLGASARFVGQTNDVVAFHHALDLYVQSSDYEGTPNALLEAMALETPIVATAAGGTTELVQDGENAVVVAPGDASALARAIRSVVEDVDGARGRAIAARRRIEDELSFEHRMRAVEKVYEELVGG
jgi:glycosyltransferase involved in cell wall biosynthesis